MPSILVDLAKLSNRFTGIGQVSVQYAHQLNLLENPPFDFHFYLPRGSESEYNNVKNFEYISAKRRYFPSLCRKYDLWHSLHQDSGYFPAYDTPYVLQILDLNFLKEKTGIKSVKRLKRLQKKVNAAAYITTISNFSKKIILKNLDTHDIPVETVYIGVNAPGPANMKRPAWLDDKPFLFAIGVVRAKKNFAVLVDMMKKLDGYNLVSAGDTAGSYAENLVARIKKEELNSRIFFVGILDDKTRAWYYQHCAALVFPSLHEGFGMPVIEAFHCGKPAFISDQSSLPEIGGKFAYQWTNFDAEYMADFLTENIAEWQNDDSLPGQVKEYASGFSWENYSTEMLKIYSRVLSEKG